MSNKTLVAYFSATGTTARAARRLAEAVGADLYEIRPAVPYTRADLNWSDSKSRSTLEAHDAACRPAIAGEPVDLSGYGTVFVGFPIWWYTAPRIIHSFLESHDFAASASSPSPPPAAAAWVGPQRRCASAAPALRSCPAGSSTAALPTANSKNGRRAQ